MTALAAPSMLSCDFGNIREELRRVEQAGADWIHWDIMDGHFVPNISFGADVVASVRQDTRLFFDVHLMLSHPQSYLDRFIRAGADLISFHVEASVNPFEMIEEIRAGGIKAGIVLNPDTPVQDVHKYLELVDLVLVMTVYPGYGGQKYIRGCTDKISRLACTRRKEGLKYLIEVDGGINRRTAVISSLAGADVLVAGSYVFGSDDIERTIRDLKFTTVK